MKKYWSLFLFYVKLKNSRDDLAQDQPPTIITTVECGPKVALKINDGSTIAASSSRAQEREKQRKTIDKQSNEIEENVELKEQKKAAWKMVEFIFGEF